jgi:conjugative relaxase-like TrwC/TraI family protein
VLSLGKIAAGPDAARYYTDQVAHGREDYYAGEGEVPGTWVGSGSSGLGRAGQVDADHFARLLEGAGLRRPPAEGAVAGFDLTFRAPKSVSVLWAIAPADVVSELRAGHDAAVTEALGYLERQACRTRRGAGGAIQVPGSGFVGAAFLHRASRAGDPLLHTHVVVGNLAQGPDGRWTALDARHLYRHAKTAGYLYQSVLRRELTDRLGLEWEPVEHGVADVRGVPRAVIDHFSQRRAEILEHLAEHGGRSAAAAQVAALETRRAKQDIHIDRLRTDWRARATEHGLDAHTVERLLHAPRLVEQHASTIDFRQLTERATTFGRPELLQALAEAQPAGAHVSDLERLADARLADPEVVALRDGPAPAGLSERRFSTRDLLAAERRLIDGARSRRGTAVGVVSARTLADVAADHTTLVDEQRRALEDLGCRGDGVAVVRAPAGTGKTFVLGAANDAWQREGIDVIGCALSARASLELHDQTGIRADTVACLRHRLSEGRELPTNGVLVVDEAGMVGTRALVDLADAAARAEAKLVLVGDDRQLPEIDAGGAFRALAEELGASELKDARRQRQPWDRAALDALRRGDVERWARVYRDAGRITVARSASAARAALINDWARADGDRLMIAGRRSDVRDLNDRARQLLRARGDLGPDALTVANRGFAIGDQVIATHNARRLGLVNGQRGTVGAIDPEHETITVSSNERSITADSAYLRAGHLDHGYAITAHRAQGATVDRTFVLGSDELYREWGYTALSRHRDEARFYVARGDLGLDRDHAPAPDPLAAGLTRLLGRSRAQELASNGLPELDDTHLDATHEDLRALLASDPPPTRTQRDEPARLRDALDDTAARLERLQTERDALGWLDRAERRARDELIATQRRHHARLSDRAQQIHDSEATWLARHGTDAELFLRLDRERRERAAIRHEAHERLEHVARAPDLLTEPASPTPDLDTGLDL